MREYYKIKFSIIIPAYNRAIKIPTTVKSVLIQKYSNFELIIIDDGSTDHTEDVIKNFSDTRIRYIKTKNAERGAARNTGIKKAKGDYITFLDSDDIVYPDFLLNAYQFIEENQAPSVFHIAYEIKNSSGLVTKRIIHTKPINQSILEGNLLSCIGVVIKNEVAKQNTFHEDRKLAGSEDWLLWLQISAKHKILACNNVSAALIQHEDRSVMNFDLDKLLVRTDILIQELYKNTAFRAKLGLKTIEKIKAHMYSYTALHAAMANKRIVSLIYFFKAIKINPKELFTRRTLAIIKNIF